MPAASVDDSAEADLRVTDQTIDDYADLLGDADRRAAREALTAGVAGAAVADLPGDVESVARELDFEEPVRAGQTVTATATVAEQLQGDKVRVQVVAETDGERALSGTAVVRSVGEDGDEQ